ncbi:extracellular solute-binding protein [Paenibacillus sp. CF384]|uniref:extracellular solute-binding protein n=1 Tax=Paenibacillus sp. CF384 TaxID=1884382 RepID=UPI000895E33F|nr:extracellular solute-binding protein [Paenibacillus sp. CF384]SDY00662.1 putative aldouronate transport system substrate-binding protein [Paenibacillus sp. CF384]
MKPTAVSLFLCASIVLSLTACDRNGAGEGNQFSATYHEGNSNEANNSNTYEDSHDDGPFTKYEKPITVTLGRQGIAGNNLPNGDTLEDNEFLSYVEDRLNVKVNYEFSIEDVDDYNQKVSLAIANNNMPDMMVVNEQQFKEMAGADMLADLTTIYETYSSPLIKDYYKSFSGNRVLNTGRINGKLYGMPNTNIDGNYQLLWVRKDWLDRLKLGLPSSLEDIQTIAQAFKEQDPDQNGKPDTVGLLGDKQIVGDAEFFTFDPVFNQYHSYPKSWFKDADGNVVYGSTTPETKEALIKLRDMYKAGLIDREFLTRKWQDNAALVSGGRAGILFAPWFAGWMLADSVKTDPKAEWVPLAAPLDGDGKRNVVPSAPSGTFLVVKKNAKHPEAALKMLSVQYEGIRLIDPKSHELYKDKIVSWLNYPLNVQLDFQDSLARDIPIYDKVVKDNDLQDMPTRLIQRVNSILKNKKEPKQDITAFADSLAYYTGGAVTGTKEITKVNPIFYGMTETMVKKGTSLHNLENETFLRIITGAAPIEDFDKFVTTWKLSGGDEVTKEVQESLE